MCHTHIYMHTHTYTHAHTHTHTGLSSKYTVVATPSQVIGDNMAVTLRCTASGTDQNVEPDILWSFTPNEEGVSVPPVLTKDGGYELEGNSLTITEVSTSDSGNYTCQAFHSLVAERLTATVEIIVQRKLFLDEFRGFIPRP